MVALTVAGLFTIVLRHAPESISSSSAGDENKIRDEAFMCAPTTPDVVIVGSSLSFRLGPMPVGWVNLAQSGGSPLTGLELVTRRADRPRVVLVESNVFGYASRNAKEDLVQEVTFPGVVKWRCDHRLLQHKYRPVDVLISMAAALRRRAQGRTTDGQALAAGEGAELEDSDETPAQRADRLEGVRVQLHDQAALSPETLDAQVRSTIAHCRALAQTGTTCLFFELPQDPLVSGAPRQRELQDRMKNATSAAGFRWLPWIDPGSVRTSDGLHMTTPSARRVTAQLARWVAAPR